jgi:hypothetical protein
MTVKKRKRKRMEVDDLKVFEMGERDEKAWHGVGGRIT